MLFHFSEEPNIRVFSPRPSAAFPELAPAVWAIDREHASHYYFPRDCPRVIYSKGACTEVSDIEKFFSDTNAEKIIVVENQWLEQIRNTTLYVYSFSEEGFELFDQTAGYYVSHEKVVPEKIEPLTDLIEKIVNEKVELRFTPDLHPIRNRVIGSTLDFSVIRFKNAGKLPNR
ncbi:DUF6886 family protein [Heyndrickxia oleronia]|uniref:DUF6886 family protein n=1 Tax=Heyndrickxia oleronia TaxID=38875 RepID=UPI002431CE1E|nr:DUF6886 family protein [Heyndrickxia oleronia]MCI1593658.1 hypothetical protein [Heyndrickxia oleronia]MCI1616010.1 hypothetical protein [Heyndrickxia oleronia]MCI1746607.1 hypothetical protein [Heyndrickxia oleronia]MCI1764405.1 hypothetical protein [Heyndrickxia oleronia]